MRPAVLGSLAFLLLSCRGEAPPRPAAEPAPVPAPLEAKVPPPPVAPPIARDLQEIAAEGALKVLFTFNSTGYFIYRGETMGYEYELLSRFAEEAECA